MQKIISIALLFTGIFLFSACQSGTENQAETNGIEEQQAPQQQPQMQSPQGQMDLSDSDLKAFAEIDLELREIQVEAREEMIGVIEDNNMTLEQYQQIAQMQQQGMTDQISESDLGTVMRINDEMGEIQMDMQGVMEEKIAEKGMSMDQYQQISMTIQQNPEYQQRVQAIQNGAM